jgi:flagellar biosynthetic protein FlhB
MTKQEVKDEFKQSEGDPQIKGKIKQKQRQMAMARMMQEVPKADVIITNPTHLAVALEYHRGMMAPVVLAKGQDFVAQRIKEIAREAGVTIVENKPLARTLYASVEIGDPVPQELYQAVAEVLAYVYRLKRRRPAYQ